MRDTADGTPAHPFEEAALQDCIAYESGPLRRTVPALEITSSFSTTSMFDVQCWMFDVRLPPLHACSKNKAANTNMKSEKN